MYLFNLDGGTQKFLKSEISKGNASFLDIGESPFRTPRSDRPVYAVEQRTRGNCIDIISIISLLTIPYH